MQHFVLGDIHGCGDEFMALLESIDRFQSPVDTHLVLIGDLLAKGPRPELVVREIDRRRRLGTRITLICGNHELRHRHAIDRLEAYTLLEELPRVERETIRILMETGTLEDANRLVLEASKTISITNAHACGLWTAVHAGIEPVLGLEETSDHLKIHIKARRGKIDWWDRYDGCDGLIIFGHKPLPEPMVRRNDIDKPIAVNIDTGCIYGGHLSAYHVESDSLLQVRSRQPIDIDRIEYAVSPTVAPIEVPSAWGARDRTFVG
jgi:predicted MPP superfamily phosphohydrolase